MDDTAKMIIAEAVYHDFSKPALPLEAWLAYCEYQAGELNAKMLEDAEETYAGEHRDFKALAESLVDDGLFGDIPDHLVNYIDCEAIGRDLRLGGEYWENNGYFFANV